MNSVAVAIRPSGLRQRSSASRPVTSKVCRAICGWNISMQIAGLDRAAQGLLQPETLRSRVIQRGFVQGVSISAELLGAEQGDVGRPQQLFRILGVIRIQARADTGAGRQQPAVDGQRLLERRHDLRGAGLNFID